MCMYVCVLQCNLSSHVPSLCFYFTKKKKKNSIYSLFKSVHHWTINTRKCQLLSHVWLFATPWTVAHKASCPWDFPGKNTGVSCHALLHGIFSTQGLNPGLLHCRRILYCLSHQGSPNTRKLELFPAYLCIFRPNMKPRIHKYLLEGEKGA